MQRSTQDTRLSGIYFVPPLAGILIALIKAGCLSYLIAGTVPSKTFFQLFGADGLMCGVLAIIFAAVLTLEGLLARNILTAIAHLFLWWYFIDTAGLLSIDHKLTFDEVRNIFQEPALILGFITPPYLIGVCCVVALLRLKVPRQLFSARRSLIVGSVHTLAGLVLFWINPWQLTKYTASVSDVFVQLQGTLDLTTPYTQQDLEYYGSVEVPTWEVDLPPGKPNIIMVVVESLSAVDSLRAGGVHDKLPELDRIAKQGMMFTNFFANHTYSAGGQVALIQGTPPMPYPTAVHGVYTSFEHEPSYLPSLKNQGYFTEIVVPIEESQLGFGEWAQAVGFDSLLTRDNVPAFHKAPRFVMQAPADEVLFRETLAHLPALSAKKPYFTVLLTNSTHPPFQHPHGGPNTEKALWNYFDTELGKFFDRLQATHFFDDGIVVITGDHHKRDPIEEQEWQRFGESAPARVPLVIVGKGVPAGVIDNRRFQHADIMRKLNTAISSSDALSPIPILVQEWNRLASRSGREGDVLVFADENSNRAYRLSLYGKELTWNGSAPSDSTTVERSIHALRASLQFHERPPSPLCHTTASMQPSDKSGLVRTVRRANEKPPYNIDPMHPPLENDTIETPYLENTAPKERKGPLRIAMQGFLKIEKTGYYQFRLGTNMLGCVTLGQKNILETSPPAEPQQRDVRLYLESGLLPLEIHLLWDGQKTAPFRMMYLQEGQDRYEEIPGELLLQRAE